MSKISKELRNKMMDAAAEATFKLLPTVHKKDLKKVKPGTVVVIKWKDSMPTAELVLDVSEDGGFQCYALEAGVMHGHAEISQIISVIGKL